VKSAAYSIQYWRENLIRYVTGIVFMSAVMLADTLNSFPADYYKIKDVKRQKESFVKILYPLILEEDP